MRKAAGIVMALVLAMLVGCGTGAVDVATATPSPAATPADSPTPRASRRPIPTPTPMPTPERTPVPPPPLHPDLLPFLINDYQEPGNVVKETYDASLLDIPLIPNDQPIFQKDDLIAGELRFGMTQEEVMPITGLPVAAYVERDDNTGFDFLSLWFPNGDFVMFHDYEKAYYTLCCVSISTDLPGPRGLRVGDTLEDVLAAFRIDEDFVNSPEPSEGPLLYANAPYNPDEKSWWTSYVIPPYGQIDFENGNPCVRYEYPILMYTNESLREDDSPLYHPSYCLNFLCEEGRIVNYTWYLL